MQWDWEKVYSALVEKSKNYSGKWYLADTNKKQYACITPQGFRNTSMILYSPKTGAHKPNRPFVYYCDPEGEFSRESYDPELIEKLSPALVNIFSENNRTQKKFWHHCEVIDWNHFAKVLGL
jgi:hypothetical protein